MKATMLLADHAEAVGGKLFINGAGWKIAPAGRLNCSVPLLLEFEPREVGADHTLRLETSASSRCSSCTTPGERPGWTTAATSSCSRIRTAGAGTARGSTCPARGRRCSLLDADGRPVLPHGVPAEHAHPVRFEAQFRADANEPDVVPDVEATFAIAFNLHAFPIAPGRFEWRLWIDGATREEWRLAFITRAAEQTA